MTRSAALSVALCALVASTAPAFSNGVAEVYLHQNIIAAPVIEVRADATGYTTTATSRLTYQLTTGGHCEPHFWLESSAVTIRRLSTGEDWFAHWDVLGNNASAPSIFEDSFEKSRDLTGLEQLDAVGRCRRFFDEQRAAGRSRAWILSRDHTIEGPRLFEAVHKLTCVRTWPERTAPARVARNWLGGHGARVRRDQQPVHALRTRGGSEGRPAHPHRTLYPYRTQRQSSGRVGFLPTIRMPTR